jgi:hypothetical protein
MIGGMAGIAATLVGQKCQCRLGVGDSLRLSCCGVAATRLIQMEPRIIGGMAEIAASLVGQCALARLASAIHPGCLAAA